MTRWIFLIHGLSGDPVATWGRFPELLDEDSEINYKVFSIGYESPNPLNLFQTPPSLTIAAQSIITNMKLYCDLNKDEIVLAGHSMGGLLVKKVMLKLKQQAIQHRISKLVFFDVPHDGAGLAAVGKKFLFWNRQIRHLCRDGRELDDLNEQWSNSGIDKLSIIMNVVAANSAVVSKGSALGSYVNAYEVIEDVDHSTIVKPQSAQSPVYRLFKGFLLEVPSITRYKNRASRDFRDWMGWERDHTFAFVQDEKRVQAMDSLTGALAESGVIIRLTGASGLGKSRLLIEAIKELEGSADRDVLYFDANLYSKELQETARQAVDEKLSGLLIIENCSVELHNTLVKEIRKAESSLKIVTLGFENESVEDSVEIHLTELSDEAIQDLLTPILIELSESEVGRVARFTQGYPLLAILIAKQYQDEGRLLGSIAERSVIKRLIDGGGTEIDADEREALVACSLFDVFYVESSISPKEVEFIYGTIANSTLKVFNRMIEKFTKRRIIMRGGAFARVVPKPLALTLARDWWKMSTEASQKALIDGLPESLAQSFADQAAYLDDEPEVRRFSRRLFEGNPPLVPAEALFMEKGSKLFRALVEVDNVSTSRALANTIENMSREQLFAVDSEVRRDLLRGLEKLCYHAPVFDQSAWSLMRFAWAENENYSNNATGMFAQLFRIRLSGTQATPSARVLLLDRMIKLEDPDVDNVILKALESAISTRGGSRSIGAEYQGAGVAIKEWTPATWPEIHDYWDKAFGMLLEMYGRGDEQRQRVLDIVGSSIRGLILQGRIEMLDKAIRRIVDLNGRYWPSALESLKHSMEYDLDSTPAEVREAVATWLEVFNPDGGTLTEQLKVLVSKPPWEHRQDVGGEYVDVAAENAVKLAHNVTPSSLVDELDTLLIGEQRQAYAFGIEISKINEDIGRLLDQMLIRLSEIESPNLSFYLGICAGIYARSAVSWEDLLRRLLDSESLTKFYPQTLRTGVLRKSHLDSLLTELRSGSIPIEEVSSISYGRVTNSIDPDELAEFCRELSGLSEQGVWIAIDLIYMYCFSREGAVEKLQETIKSLILKISVSKEVRAKPTDLHHWFDFSSKFFEEPYLDEEFAVNLVELLLSSAEDGFDYGDIWTYISPLLSKAMDVFPDGVWRVASKAIVDSDLKKRYWVEQLLKSERSDYRQNKSVLSKASVNDVIRWCEEYPEIGPVFVASAIDVFEESDERKSPTPICVALLESFGDRDEVQSELIANMQSRSWSGSLVPYLEADIDGVQVLKDHSDARVSNWAHKVELYFRERIESESQWDEEHDLRFH